MGRPDRVFFRRRRRLPLSLIVCAFVAIVFVRMINAPAATAPSVQFSSEQDGPESEYIPEIEREVRLPRGVADKDCKDFDSRAEAQDFLEDADGDPHRVDGDDDGIACERLR